MDCAGLCHVIARFEGASGLCFLFSSMTVVTCVETYNINYRTKEGKRYLRVIITVQR